MKELFGEQLPTVEKKPEIITDTEEVRRAMQDFWHQETDLESFKAEIELREITHIKNLLRLGHETEVLRKFLDEKKEEFPLNPSHFIFASQNEKKHRMVAEITKEQDLFLQKTMFPMTQEEEEKEHQILKQLIRENRSGRGPKTVRNYTPKFYAIDVAEAKALKMHETFKNRAIIGADIVVSCGNRILEKPKNRDDAIEILKSISGKKTKISFGITLITPTSFGKTVLIKNGGYFDIKLRNFSNKEASEYLNQYGKDYLGVVGVLDYASSLAQKIISAEPVKIKPLQLARKFGEANKQILISSDTLPQLKDYFMGIPKELVLEMLKQGKLLQKSPK